MWWPFRRNMLTCRQLIDLLSDYVDGDLSPPLQRRLEAHLAGCEPCIAFLQTFKQTQSMARTMHDEDMPPELRQRLWHFLREQLPKEPPV